MGPGFGAVVATPWSAEVARRAGVAKGAEGGSGAALRQGPFGLPRRICCAFPSFALFIMITLLLFQCRLWLSAVRY